MTPGLHLAAAAGVALATVAVVVVLVANASPYSRAEQADALARELRCPDCQGLSVADSPTSSAIEIRRQIDELLAAGATPEEVRAHFTARYGDWILLAPRSPAAWLVPLVAVAAGAVALAAWIARSQPAQPTVVPASGTADRRQLREDVESLDA